MNPPKLEIRIDDLSGSEIRALLADHLRALSAITPQESMHALDIDELKQPDVTFWSAWSGNELLGCGALKELDSGHGEIKSMRTTQSQLRRGTASAILRTILAEARRRSYRRLSLETGVGEPFRPAHRLYQKHGFRNCPPFADYREDPNSAFMTRELAEIRPATREDFDQLLVLFRQLWPTKLIVPERLGAVFARAMSTPSRQYFCAIEEGQIVGLGGVSFRDNLWQEGEIAYVEELVVHEKCRGKGIGWELLDRFTELARTRGCRRIELDSGFHREAAHRFYEQHGLEKRAFLFSRVLNPL